jgi:hypothetical protein
MQLSYSLPAGTYALIDFDQNMATGRPEALDGMYAIATLRVARAANGGMAHATPPFAPHTEVSRRTPNLQACAHTLDQSHQLFEGA